MSFSHFDWAGGGGEGAGGELPFADTIPRNYWKEFGL